jgi:hypothetical protein
MVGLYRTIQLGQRSNLLYYVVFGRTFFFCFRQASHPRPEGTPGMLLSCQNLKTMIPVNRYKV